MIKIAGGGPAGLACAIVLQKAGFKVQVFERRKIGGQRFAGDLQGIDNWTHKLDALKELKSLGIDSNFETIPIKNYNVVDSNSKIHHLKSHSPLFYLVERGPSKQSFDSYLYNQAREVGVHIINGKEIKKAEADIIATGPSHVDFVVQGITFETNSKNSVYIFRDKKFGNGGYGYVFIGAGKGCIGAVAFKGHKNAAKNFKILINKIRNKGELSIKNSKRFGSYGNIFLPSNYKVNGSLLLGEAGGMMDAVAGSGLRFALVSGGLAAKSIITGKDYDELIKKRIRPFVETSIANRFLYDLMSDKIFSIYHSIHPFKKDGNKILHDWYSPNPKKNLIVPFAKWLYKNNNCNINNSDCEWCMTKSK